jgi:putative ABC transport system permease protein
VSHSPRLRQALVVGQVALTVVLLCGAGLLVRTLLALDGTALGFDRGDVLTMQVALPPARYDAERREVFFRDAVQALRRLPSTSSAAAGDSLPVIGRPQGLTVFHRVGTPKLPMNESPVATVRVVTTGFFRTLGIPVLRGREFTQADEGNAAPGFVVNETFVQTYLEDDDPLGVVMSVLMRGENPYRPIIGVVGDVSEGSLRKGTEPLVYYNHSQLTESAMTLFVRADRAEALARPAVAVIQEIDPDLAVTEVRTIEAALAESIARERLSALVAGGFALSALLLSSLGLYGLLALLVTERTKEFGIRIALGERLGRLKASVVGGGLRLVVAGGALGVCGSLLLLRSFPELLFGVTPYDASTYAAVVAILCAVGVLASYLPANRAARVEPLAALRQE